MNNEQPEIKIGDIVQCNKMPDVCVLGIVMEVSATHYKCHMREPNDYGAKRIDFRVNVGDCVKVGKAKFRPLLPGERPRQQQAAAPAPPPPKPEKTKPQPVLPRKATVAPSVAAPSERAASAGGISTPAPVDDIDPAMLQTAIFRGPSAYDAHNLKPPVPRPEPVTAVPVRKDSKQSAPVDPMIREEAPRKRHVRMKRRRGVK